MRWLVLVSCVLLLSFSATTLAQQTIVAPSRRIDWTLAGAGVIPTTRTQCGSTLTSSSTVSQINTAISNCGSNQFVLLGSGTFHLDGEGQIKIAKSNVTLRGSGPDSTTLVMTGNPTCTVYAAHICVNARPGGGAMDGTAPQNVMTLSGGYTVGSTAITIGNGFLRGSTKPQVGWNLILDQTVDATTRSGDTWPGDFVCLEIGPCTLGGPPDSPVDGRGSSSTARGLFQIVQVTSITGDSTCSTGCAVGITPPIHSPDWKSSLTPQAWWDSSAPIHGVGVENMTIEHDTDSACGGWCSAIGIEWAHNSWVKNVKITGEIQHYDGGVDIEYSTQITVRDSYVFDTNTNDDYGIDPRTVSELLVENNIFQHTRTPMVVEGGNGFVIAYNYTIANCDPNNQWSYGAFVNHGSGGNFWLLEGNDAMNYEVEDVHGALAFTTSFRNRFDGTDHGSRCTSQSVPGFLYTLARFHNYVGNVLGTSGYHRQYQTIAGASTGNCNVSIYALGLGGDCGNGGGSYPPNDTHVAESLMRWGNWDVVTNGTKWDASEVPTGLANFANPVPTSQVLPPSFYLSAKPGFFGSHVWPPIGPDVTGGDLPNVGGHAYRIPARICFEDVMRGTYADTSARTFNAANCYIGNGTAPVAPVGFRVVG
jgi:hypothetical protein